MRYAVVIEKAEQNYSAYVPDLPGCIATGTSIEYHGSIGSVSIAPLLACIGGDCFFGLGNM